MVPEGTEKSAEVLEVVIMTFARSIAAAICLACFFSTAVVHAENFIVDKVVTDYEVHRSIFEDPDPDPDSDFDVRDEVLLPLGPATITGGDTVDVTLVFPASIAIIPDDIEFLQFELYFFDSGGTPTIATTVPELSFEGTSNITSELVSMGLRLLNGGDARIAAVKQFVSPFEPPLLDGSQSGSFMAVTISFQVPGSVTTSNEFQCFFRVTAFASVDSEDEANSLPPMLSKLPTPEALISTLVDDVFVLNLAKGIHNALNSKLDAALSSLEADNARLRSDTVKHLNAFIKQLWAQSGKKIPEIEADFLVGQAQEIIALLSALP
ncbi:MAG: hypothetical protein IH991_09465 [Planctomycetes bacterium]|nr:hypothetical protein [Planctomycetota bacterium]